MRNLWELLKDFKNLIITGLAGVPVGAAAGVLTWIFGGGLVWIGGFRSAHAVWLMPFLPLAGIFIVFMYQNFGNSVKHGMSLVFRVGQGEQGNIPIRLIPFAVGATWITHLFGGSAGREGVAVQIGSTFSHFMGKRLPVKDPSKTFLITGMAAGFAGLFQTPMAACCFALEVLDAGGLEYGALIPAMTAAFTASKVSSVLGLGSEVINIDLVPPQMNYILFLKLVILGIVFGLVGGGFAYLLKTGEEKAEEVIKNPYVRVISLGAASAVLLMLFGMGRYSGAGGNLVEAAFRGEEIFGYDWILKFGLTILTLSAGFQGGEVAPLFSIGTTLGYVIAPYLGLPRIFAAALGFCGAFGAGTNTFLAAILVGGEIFGFKYIPFFFVVCGVSYMINHNESIYPLQKIRY